MAVRRGSTRCVAGLVMVVMLVMAANGWAQQPGSQPPGSEPAPPPIRPITPLPRDSVPGPAVPRQVVLSFPQPAVSTAAELPEQSRFKIDPKAPVTDFLPTPPSVAAVTGPLLTDDLAK